MLDLLLRHREEDHYCFPSFRKKIIHLAYLLKMSFSSFGLANFRVHIISLWGYLLNLSIAQVTLPIHAFLGAWCSWEQNTHTHLFLLFPISYRECLSELSCSPFSHTKLSCPCTGSLFFQRPSTTLSTDSYIAPKSLRYCFLSISHSL